MAYYIKRLFLFMIDMQPSMCCRHLSKMPREFQSRCRAIQECNSWKGTEARQFLLYLSPVILKDTLNKKMYERFKMLPTTIRCLCCKEFLAIYTDHATSWLEQFVNNYVKYYGN